jgi:hypothetical protein
MLGAAGPARLETNTPIWVGDIAAPAPDASLELAKLAAKLTSLNDADRRLDSEVARLVLGPQGARLDPDEGLDGWDILTADGQLWMEAADVPYATGYIDAAQQLCRQAAGNDSDAIVVKALKRVTKAPHRFDQGDLAGLIARYILAGLVEWTAERAAR